MNESDTASGADTRRGFSPLRSTYSVLALLLVYLLLYWSDLRTYRPGMDSMTYGAVARHMVETGNYLVPHYSSQAYANFFQHPPLGLWLMAGTMKLAGILFGRDAAESDLILKFLPSLCGALIAIIVYAWSKRLRGVNFAFLATLVLLTSTRFVKYSKGYMLDPFIAAFSVAAVYTACESRLREKWGSWLAFLSGVFVAAAFLSKGLFAFAPLVLIFCVLFADFIATKKRGSRIVLYSLGIALPMLAWFAFGDAANYLHHYYIEHVAGRVGSHPLLDHLAPLRNLLKVYWPWFPFFFLGIVVLIRQQRPFSSREAFVASLRNEETILTLGALAFLGGFCVVASFLEQYHTAFYPFAAVTVVIGLPKRWVAYTPKLEKALFLVTLALAVFLIFSPTTFRSREFENPLRKTLRLVRSACPEPEIHRFVVSTGVAEIWYGLAVGSWYSNADAYSTSALRAPDAIPAELLLANTKEPIDPGWEKTAFGVEPYALYRKRGAAICLGQMPIAE